MKSIFNSLKIDSAFRKVYKGRYVDLQEKYRISETIAFDGVPTVYYDILLHNTNKKVGKCDLRLKIDERMYYYGNVGSNINPEHRGHHYAYHACKILFKIAKEEFNQEELIITCNPNNEPSYKTLRALNGELIDVVKIPETHELYRNGDTHKCIFKYRLDNTNGKTK